MFCLLLLLLLNDNNSIIRLVSVKRFSLIDWMLCLMIISVSVYIDRVSRDGKYISCVKTELDEKCCLFCCAGAGLGCKEY